MSFKLWAHNKNICDVVANLQKPIQQKEARQCDFKTLGRITISFDLKNQIQERMYR
jgi:hypothetical protein